MQLLYLANSVFNAIEENKPVTLYTQVLSHLDGRVHVITKNESCSTLNFYVWQKYS